MKAPKSLAHQIITSTVAVTVSMMLVTMVGVYLFYSIIMAIAPHLVDVNAETPGSIELMVLLGFCLLGLLVAVFVSIRLARRIVLPLNSVAAAAQKLASTDLTARAEAGDGSIGETAVLVNNFNALAERLQKASDEVSQWNVLIAHELRTPVTILMGRLQGLSDGVFEPDPALFQSLHKQAAGLARLIEDLRTVGLFYGGHLMLDRAPTDLTKEMESVALFMDARVQEAGFWLDVELEPCQIDVDAARLRQAVVALIDNALKYADPCSLRLELKHIGRDVEIAVIDQGPGMSEELAEIAFDMFQRGETEKDESRGMGIGLAAVRAIAEAHSGNASYTKDERGCAFRLRLP